MEFNRCGKYYSEIYIKKSLKQYTEQQYKIKTLKYKGIYHCVKIETNTL